MHMGTSLNSGDHRHLYVGYVFQKLNAFVVNLAPNARIGGIAERGPIDISNELPTCAREDYDLFRSILRNPVEGLDKFRVSWRGHNERPRRCCGTQQPARRCHLVSASGCAKQRNNHFEIASVSPLCVFLTVFASSAESVGGLGFWKSS